MSSAIADAITAMPTQTSRTKNLLPAFADILATSSETAGRTGSEGTRVLPQVAAKPQSASGLGNRVVSIAHASAETAAQASGPEQLIPAYALRMSDWVMPSAEDSILTMKRSAPSETTITASSAPSSSVAGSEVSGPQTSNGAAATPTNVTPATLIALNSSLPMSRRDAWSTGFPGEQFLENTLPVAERSNHQPVTSAEFEPSPVEAFVSPPAPPSSAPTGTSQGDVALKAFSGSAQPANSSSNRLPSTATNLAPLPFADSVGTRPSRESSFGSTTATLTVDPAEIATRTMVSAPTTTVSSTQVSQNIGEAPASNKVSPQPVPAEVSAGGAETDTLAQALGVLLRRFAASGVTSTVISNVPSVVTTTSVPALAQSDFVTTNSMSVSEQAKETASNVAPVLANANLAPTGSVDTTALDASATILPPPDFATLTTSYEQDSERNQPRTDVGVSSAPSAPDAGPADVFAQTLSAPPVSTPIVSQPIAQEPTTTTASPLMTSTVRTSMAPSTVVEASSVLEAMVAQTVEAVLTQAPASAPHASAYSAEPIAAPAMKSTTPVAAEPFIIATATAASSAPQQKAPSQSFVIGP
jgi:hypothetical protein